MERRRRNHAVYFGGLHWYIPIVPFSDSLGRQGIFNPDATQFVAMDKTCKLTAMLRSAAGKNALEIEVCITQVYR